MKTYSPIFILLPLIFLLQCCSPTIEGDVIITDVNIVDVKTGDIHADMDVVIVNNKIVSILSHKKSAKYQAEQVIIGSEKFLIPGLWDMHAHTSSESNTKNILFPLFIANGVTGIRVLASDCFEPCWSLDMNITQSRSIQREVQNGSLIGPKTILASTFINGGLTGESSVEDPKTEEDGRALVHLLKSRGVDFIKIYDELQPAAYHGIADEAQKLGLDFAGHIPIAVKTSEASEAGQKSIEHCCDGNLFNECTELEEEMREKILELFRTGKDSQLNDLTLEMIQVFDSVKCQKIYELFKKNNTWFVPTLRLVETYYPNAANWTENPNTKYLPKDEFDYYVENEKDMRNLFGPVRMEIEKRRLKIVSDMNTSGVGLLAGTDCGETGIIHGFSLHEELESLVHAGLSPLEALQTATINPARYQDATDRMGTIAVEQIADLVLLNKNPLDEISNTKKIEAVFTNGQIYNRSVLDSILNRVELKAKETYN